MQTGGTVLLVDDEDLLRQSLSAMLEHLGATVLPASNGAEGVEVFQQNSDSIDMAIVDMSMPVMNGPEAIAKMHKIKAECKFVALTGHSEFKMDSKDVPITAVLKKPFSIRVLADLLNEELPQPT